MQAARCCYFFFFVTSFFSRPVEARSAGCSRCRLGLHPPQDPGALTPGKTCIGWMGRTGDGLGSVLVVGLEYVGVLEQLSKWSNNLSGISLAVSPVSPPPLPPTYLTPDYAFPGLVLPQTFHTPQVRSAACAARSIQCGPLADDVKHGLHPANGLLSLDLGPVTQGGGKVSKCEGMISMAWEGNRERERARVLIRRDQTTKASSVVACPLSVWGSAPIPPFAFSSLLHENQSFQSTNTQECQVYPHPRRHRPRLRHPRRLTCHNRASSAQPIHPSRWPSI